MPGPPPFGLPSCERGSDRWEPLTFSSRTEGRSLGHDSREGWNSGACVTMSVTRTLRGKTVVWSATEAGSRNV
eukprot:9189346-Pyramimonas_sp.AAC.1